MENVIDTCTKDCAFYKKYMKPGKQNCPFFVNTTWAKEKSSDAKVVNDCTHKRSLFLQTEAFNRMQGLHMAFDEQRNKSGENTDVILKMAQTFNTMVREVFTKHLQIPYEDILLIDIESEATDGKTEICETN